MADKQAEVVTHSPVEMLLTEEVAEYWSPERMESAEPIPIEFESQAIRLLTEQESAATVQTAATQSEPSVSSGRADSTNVPTEPQPPVPASGPRTEEVLNRNIFPYQPVGKLFMTGGFKVEVQ